MVDAIGQETDYITVLNQIECVEAVVHSKALIHVDEAPCHFIVSAILMPLHANRGIAAL